MLIRPLPLAHPAPEGGRTIIKGSTKVRLMMLGADQGTDAGRTDLELCEFVIIIKI